jgi:hypothetical protein
MTTTPANDNDNKPPFWLTPEEKAADDARYKAFVEDCATRLRSWLHSRHDQTASFGIAQASAATGMTPGEVQEGLLKLMDNGEVDDPWEGR